MTMRDGLMKSHCSEKTTEDSRNFLRQRTWSPQAVFANHESIGFQRVLLKRKRLIFRYRWKIKRLPFFGVEWWLSKSGQMAQRDFSLHRNA